MSSVAVDRHVLGVSSKTLIVLFDGSREISSFEKLGSFGLVGFCDLRIDVGFSFLILFNLFKTLHRILDRRVVVFKKRIGVNLESFINLARLFKSRSFSSHNFGKLHIVVICAFCELDTFIALFNSFCILFLFNEAAGDIAVKQDLAWVHSDGFEVVLESVFEITLLVKLVTFVFDCLSLP